MTLSEELAQLADMHQRGQLSDGEFSRAKARVLGDAEAARAGAALSRVNGLQRSRSERWLGGVCGGLAELTGMAVWLWRLMFALLVLCAGTGVAVYLLLWLLLPSAPLPPATPQARLTA